MLIEEKKEVQEVLDYLQQHDSQFKEKSNPIFDPIIPAAQQNGIRSKQNSFLIDDDFEMLEDNQG